MEINPNESTQEPLYVMTVELEEGNSQTIKIFPNSTPPELAFEFCKKNNLDINAMNYLAEQIKNLLEELNQTYKCEEEHETNENNLMQNEHECIQEVDEDEFQTEKTKKTHRSNNQSDSKNFKQVFPKSLMILKGEHTNENTNENINENITENITENIYENYIDDENILAIHNQEDKENQRLQYNNNNSEEENIVKERIPSNISKTKLDYQNKEILNTNKLAEEQIKGENEQELKAKQQLFTYEMLYNTLKNRGNKCSSETEKSKKAQADTVFEKLFRNEEHKKYGAYGNKSYQYQRDSSHYTSNNNKQYPCNILNNSDTTSSNLKKVNVNNSLPYKNGEVINYGERLYQKGLKLKEETLKRLDVFKREQEMEDAGIFTYTPQINLMTPEMLKKRNENSLVYNKDECILKYNNYLEEKLQKLRNKHDKREEYSFSPNINKNSDKIANNNMRNKLQTRMTNSVPPDPHQMRIEDLYGFAKVKQFKIDQLKRKVYSAYNYTPQLNDYNNSNYEVLNLKFDQRQEVYRMKSLEKMNKIKEDVLAPFDKSTGQSLFVPKIRSKSTDKITQKADTSSANVTHQHTSNIFQSLYSYAQKYTKNKVQREIDVTMNIKKFSQSVFTINDSEFLFNKKKEEVFRKIFKILDTDEDDSISSFNLDTRRLPDNIVSLLRPILTELKEENETLNENEFVKACQHLYELLSYNEKRTLIQFHGKKDERNNNFEFTFKPTINKNSRKIANSKQYAYSFSRTNILSDNKLNSVHNSMLAGEENKRSTKSFH